MTPARPARTLERTESEGEASSGGAGPLRRLLQNLALALVSILMLLAAAEVVFRVAAWREDRKILDEALRETQEPPAGGDARLIHVIRPSTNPDIVYELLPNLSVSLFGQQTTTNQAGFRDRDYPLAKGPDTFRIVGIGDSFMFGWKLPDGQDFLSRLEAKLNHQRPDLSWEVVNTSVPGYNTVMEVATLEEKGLAYSPDMVLIDLVGNDLDLPNFVRSRRDPWSLRESFLAADVARRWALLTRSGREASAEEDGGSWAQPVARLLRSPPRAVEGREAGRRYEHDLSRIPPEYRHLVGWEAFTGAIRRLRVLAERNDFQVVATYLAPGLPADMKPVIEYVREQGIRFIDVSAAMRQHMADNGIARFAGSELSIGESDGHLSALGHRVAARKILREIRDLLPPPPG